MSNNEYTKRLENVIKQMLQPLKDIPFNLVIESMTGKKVISFDFAKSDHQKILSLLKQAALNAGKEINKTGILRSRPNEVGNDALSCFIVCIFPWEFFCIVFSIYICIIK